MFRWTYTVIFIFFLVTGFFLFFFNTTYTTRKAKLEVLNRWNECARRQLSTVNTAPEFWLSFADLLKPCDASEEIGNVLTLEKMKNDDEMKYAILPILEGVNSTFVTLGIGKDIRAELRFKDLSTTRQQVVNFYGADPITDENEELYSRIGTFYPFAVGSKSEMSIASVFLNGTYVKRTVKHVQLLQFLQKNVRTTEIDHLWLDAEGAEFGLFDYFYNDGPLERNGVFFCQMNLEIHSGDINRKIEFMKFVKRVASERRFAMIYSMHYYHSRIFLFNYANPKCQKKYM